MEQRVKIAVIILGGFADLWFILWGVMMRKMDFSFLLDDPWGKRKGLFMGTPAGPQKVAEDTPENRKKASKILGNFFIIFPTALYLLFILRIIIS